MVSERSYARPFDLDRNDDYQRWRDWKLSVAPADADALSVAIRDPDRPSSAELARIREACHRSNMAIYRFVPPDMDARQARQGVKALAAALGLLRLDANLCADPDGIASLQVVAGGRAGEYIPYSNRPIRWHTDGYYNAADQRILAMLLHCVRPAAEGGANQLLDPELLYIQLRDEQPDYIRALMAPDAMLIPPNVENGVTIRPARSGPVFEVDPTGGGLHMRYTARSRSIQWKDDAVTQAAVERLAGLLEAPRYALRHRLQAGEGVVCNNVLHTRDGFVDAADPARGRLYLRARYLDRVAESSATGHLV